MIVEVVGLGAVGRRLLTELLSTPSVELVRVRSRRHEVAAAQVGGLERVEIVRPGQPVHADWAAITVEASAQRTALRRTAEADVPAVSCCDDPELIAELLDGELSSTPVVVGAALSPGLTDVMAAHAATPLEEATELHVARHGVGDLACAEARSQALRRAGRVGDGAWVERSAGSGRELWFFPEPVGGRDTYRADLAEVQTLHAAHPQLERLTARISMTRRERMSVAVGLPPLPSAQKPSGMGAAIVEARGRQGSTTTAVVLGVVDRLEGAVAALIATCGEQLEQPPNGAVTAGQLAPPPERCSIPLLAEASASLASASPGFRNSPSHLTGRSRFTPQSGGCAGGVVGSRRGSRREFAIEISLHPGWRRRGLRLFRSGHCPAGSVGDPVVVPAQKPEVVDVGWAVVVPFIDVVGVAPAGGRSQPGKIQPPSRARRARRWWRLA